MDTHLSYPGALLKVGDGWQFTYRDIPEAIGEAPTAALAVRKGIAALGEAIRTRMEYGLEIPTMSRPRRGEKVIPVPELED